LFKRVTGLVVQYLLPLNLGEKFNKIIKLYLFGVNLLHLIFSLATQSYHSAALAYRSEVGQEIEIFSAYICINQYQNLLQINTSTNRGISEKREGYHFKL
jgi:hypothetical protein